MNRHPKAARTGSSAGNRNAKPHGVRRPRRKRLAPLALVPAVVLLLGLVLSTSANAEGTRFFKETFGSAAQPTFANPQGLAVDYFTGDLLVMDQGSGTVSRFNSDGTPDDFSALGTNVISETPEGPLVFASATESQIAVDNSGTATDGNIYVTDASAHVIDIFARSGEYLGRLTEAGGSPLAEACGVAAGSGGALYVGDFSLGIDKFLPTANPPTNSDFDPTFNKLGGSGSPCTLAAGAGPTASALFAVAFGGSVYKLNAVTGASIYEVSGGASTTATVNPETGNVFVASGGEVSEYDASGSSEASKVSTLAADSAIQGVAVSPSGEVYVTRAGVSGIEVFSTSFPSPETKPATAVGVSTAALHGALYPEGLQYTDCKFEYGLTTSATFEHTADCNPPANAISPDFTRHEVSAALSGLQSNSSYRFRVTATNANGASSGEELTFTTVGQPRIMEIRARDATQSSATLEAMINPSGFGTSYRFEWGPTTSYGHEIPAEFEPFVGSGTEPVLVTAKISGLAAGTPYHYRVVATNSVDRTESPDQKVETLNSCGLPEQRCFEIVSRRDAGPVALPGQTGQVEIAFQAANDGNSLAYSAEAGYPDATRGALVLYRGIRGPDGWTSTQLSPPILAPNNSSSGLSNSSSTRGLTEDLSCGIVESTQPLTSDASTRLVVEAGSTNLYRRNPDDSYTAISRLAPENLSQVDLSNELEPYVVFGFSSDCGKVVFSTPFTYPGVPGVPDNAGGHLYEWDEGILRSVGVVPTPSGETMVAATPGTPTNHSNVVSEDGRRVFFSAERQTSSNPEEVGRSAIFVREDGAATRDLSMSETSTPSTGATYQFATPDGSRVFFTANAGLTDESNAGGTDLYEYDLESERLTDLSVAVHGDEARVAGFLGASQDGLHVYFAAAGQLVPGRGKTLAGNESAETYSVYGASGGDIRYVGVIRAADLIPVTVQDRWKWSSQVSPDGRYLLFETKANVTGYQSGGVSEAYLYDANANAEATVCISCRQDHKPSVTPSGNLPLPRLASNPLYAPRRLVTRGGNAKVFFNSFDRLASGAVEGQLNLYEWSHGQVFRIATEPLGLRGPSQDNVAEEFIRFADASADGSDLYFATPETLSWEDGDGRISVYSARIGGGFPEGAAPPAACDPIIEGSCQGSPSPAPPGVPGAASTAFSGPGNVKQKHKKKKQKHKKKKKQQQQKKKKNRTQHANGNGRAGK